LGARRPLLTAVRAVAVSAHGPVFRTFRKGLLATTERPISETGIAAPIQPIIEQTSRPPEKGSPSAVDPARNARLELPLDGPAMTLRRNGWAIHRKN
jgi:hypothetical protein